MDNADRPSPDAAVEASDTAAAAPTEDLSQSILYEVVENHICKITLNRPHRKNAILTPIMNVMLAEAFVRAQEDDAVKVIVLGGVGTDFCSGEDTQRLPIEAFGLKKGGRLGQSPRMRGIRKLLDSTLGSTLWGDKVVILAGQGAVLGQGYSFAMTADILILSEDAYVARRQSRIGFAGFETQLPMTLMRLGLNRGMEALLTGRTMSAAELKDWGVANSVVPRAQLEDEAMRYARAVAAHSTDNLMLGKRALQQYYHGMGMAAFQNFATVAHPLFTNMVWREDEINFLRERDKVGGRQAMKNVNQVWEDLGFK